MLGAVLADMATTRCFGVRPAAATALRAIAVSVAAHAAALAWSTPGMAVVLKLVLFALAVPLAFALLGEFSPAERRAIRDIVVRRLAWRPA